MYRNHPSHTLTIVEVKILVHSGICTVLITIHGSHQLLVWRFVPFCLIVIFIKSYTI